MGRIKVISIEDSRTLDRETIQRGFVSGEKLMGLAGKKLADFLLQYYQNFNCDSFFLLAGKGNNGGDIFAAALSLIRHKIRFRLLMTVRPEYLKGDALIFFRKYFVMQGVYFCLDSLADLEKHLNEFEPEVIVDGLLGSGFRPPLSNFYHQLISEINKYSAYKISVDLPSGLYRDFNPEKETAVRADETVMIGSVKSDLLHKNCLINTGRINVVDIGFPAEIVNKSDIIANLYERDDLLRTLGRRHSYSNKGDYGRVLIIGGNRGMPGAMILALKGALRSGAGLVSFVTHENNYQVIHSSVPEATSICESLFFENSADYISRYDSVLVGPGLGTDSWAHRMLLKAISCCQTKYLVFDADALNILSSDESLLNKVSSVLILTPHPKEAARLLGISSQDVENDRFSCLNRLVEKYRAAVILKGSQTLTKAEEALPSLHLTGSPAMAQGGTGDVLAGMVTSFAAQGLSEEDAMNVAVSLHGHAARSMEKKGFFGWGAEALSEEIYQTYRSLYKIKGAAE